jgi:hypothetical protein
MKKPEEYFTNPKLSTMLEEAKRVMEVEAENEELLRGGLEVGSQHGFISRSRKFESCPRN